MKRALASTVVCSMLAASTALADEDIVIQISTVLASNSTTQRAFDPRLEPLRPELKRLRFRSYRLVRSEARAVGLDEDCAMELPGGRYLHITTREHDADSIRLNILLNENNRPILNTDVQLDHDSVVLLGGPHDEDGTLLISIGSVRRHQNPPTVETLESSIAGDGGEAGANGDSVASDGRSQ
jgi:hypothetical protein